MRSNLSIKGLGLSASAVLAIPYVLIMFTSLLLVSIATTGSWQAALLGITWNSIVGFEIGLLGIVIASFALALALVPAYSAIQHQVMRRSSPPARASQALEPSARVWALRMLIALFVLLPLILLVLRALAAILSSDFTAGTASADTQSSGVQIYAVNMGPTINTAFREAEPSFTADGRTMYFNCHNYDICVSHLIGTWEEGNWTPPALVGAPISTEFEEIEPVINGADDKLYFTSIRPNGSAKDLPFLAPFIDVLRVVNMLATGNSSQSFFGGLGLSDVWVSYRINGVWSEPQNINDIASEPHVNTQLEDHCLFFSADGNEAFWTSTRPDGFGSDDIWTSRRLNGKWTEPVNLGPNINTPASEHTSIPIPNGQSLYVTTTRDGGYGGEDNYITTRGADGKWGPLVNLGSLINGPGDDRCPAWTPDFKIFLFDSVREGGFGGRDIWWGYFKDVMGRAQMSTGGINVDSGLQVSNYIMMQSP